MKNDLLKLEIQLFGATNSTTNYHLSQYIGTDKPTYLGDYNSDMSKIDTAVKANETASTTNASNITTINTNIGTMSNLKTTASNLVGAINENVDTIGDLSDLTSPNKTSVVNAINSVNTNVGDVTTLKTDSKTSTVSAINELYGLFDFTVTQISTSSLTSSNVTNIGSDGLAIAINSDGSMFKFYGEIRGTNGDGAGMVKYSSSLRPDTDITINGLERIQGESFDYSTHRHVATSMIIRTNGDIEVYMQGASGRSYVKVFLPPCIYILKDFGDQPVQP